MKLSVVLGNSQKLDGGAMFGNAPKALWQKWCPANNENQIDLVCRCLLIELPNRKILLETGIGQFFPPKLKERFGVVEKENIIIKSLKNLSLDLEEITDIVLSHLHFDHCGGILKNWEENTPPELLFPNANIFVGKEAFERAETPHLRDKASFIKELPRLLCDSGRLKIIEKANHSDLPSNFQFRKSEGHTPGLILTEIIGDQRSLIFVSDLIPGTPWIHAPITMGYDRFPERVIDEKIELLNECYEKNHILYFTHDPIVACSEVLKNEKGKFYPNNPQNTFQNWNF